MSRRSGLTSFVAVLCLTSVASPQSVGPVTPIKVQAGDLADVSIPWTGEAVSIVTTASGVRVIRQYSDDPKTLLLAVLGRTPGEYEIAIVAAAVVDGKARQTAVKVPVTVGGPVPVPPNPGPTPPGPDVPPLPPDNPPGPGPAPPGPDPFVPPDNFRFSFTDSIREGAAGLDRESRSELAKAHRKAAAKAKTARTSGEIMATLRADVTAAGISVPADLSETLAFVLDSADRFPPESPLTESRRTKIGRTLEMIARTLSP